MSEPSAKEVISRYESGLKVTVEERTPGAIILRLVGVLAIDTSSILRDKISELAKRRDLRKVVLDLGGVTYMDSSGIGTLVTGSTALSKNGIDLVITQLTPRIHDLFQITKLYTFFHVYDSLEKALA